MAELVFHLVTHSGKVRHNMAEPPDIPKGAEWVSLRLEPAAGMAFQFRKWREEKRQELEAAGVVITAVDGVTFTGYYFPETVDRSCPYLS